MTKRKPMIAMQVKDYGHDDINRLAIVDATLVKMDKAERERAFRFFKTKYSAEWPSDQF